MTVFHMTGPSPSLVLVRLWSSSDYGVLTWIFFFFFIKRGEERLAVVLEKLCLSRIRDTNMLIIVSHRTAKKHFPVIP